MKKLGPCIFLAIAALSVFTACEKETVAVTGVELESQTLTLTVGDTETLEFVITPENASDKTATWSSSKPDVASVDGGIVTAITAGETTITVTTKNGGKTATCTVTIGEKTVPVESISLNKEAATLVVGATMTLTENLVPGNATNKSITWESSNTDVATVENGVVTAIATGQATISVIATGGSDVSDDCTVTVNENLMGTASFKTDNTWTVGSQTWSDAVMATRCRKEEFDGGAYGKGEYKIDCRSNEFPGDDYNDPQVYGDFFSWEAVNTQRSILCPEPWRTPTAQDFIDLDIALGGDGVNNEMLSGRIQRYLAEWGGEFGGYCWVDPTSGTNILTVQEQTQYACYWTGESVSKSNAAGLFFGTPRGYLSPAGNAEKTNGYTLRCIK
jgi:uncharacterized protein (TIGR02145 family)